MNQIKWLILKDFRIDWRSKFPVAGIVLYILSLTVVCYLSFTRFISPEIWNALFWLILLFISITAVAKSFTQERDRSLYQFFLVQPENIILAKFIYYSLYQLVLIGLALVIFSLFLGFPVVQTAAYLSIVSLGSLGLSCTFTFISAISSKTNNNSVLMAVLGLPIIVPVLILSVTSSQVVLLGGEINDTLGNLLTLLSVIVIIIASAYILFPYIWKS